MAKYKILASHFSTPEYSNELKKALSHSSFYKKENKGNSRYVFAGMFAFRGLVAEYLFKYSAVSGTQMQHVLGNMFKNEPLNKIFTFFNLQNYIRYGIDFQVDNHKHIFVFGLLGWLFTHCSKEIKQQFISRHFILPNSEIAYKKEKNSDIASQCAFMAKMLFNKKIKIFTRKENEQHITEISVKSQILASESSTGYRYSRTKALKTALLALSVMSEGKNRLSPDYESRHQYIENLLFQKSEQEKEAKHQTYLQKQEQKKAEREKRKADRQAKAIETDIARRNAKNTAKIRKEQQAKKAALEAAKMANMSADKRRRLQDRGWVK
jgi:hypothetical protein